MTRKQRRIYRKAYALLEHHTPLRADCGVLCGRACCRGDGETGMLLFPGEETPFRVLEKNGRRIAVCGGRCRRADRPLGCRLFPFLPQLEESGRVRVRLDSRGFGLCPLVRRAEAAAFSHRFLHRVRRVGKRLLRDRESRAFLAALWRESEESDALRRQFPKNNLK